MTETKNYWNKHNELESQLAESKPVRNYKLGLGAERGNAKNKPSWQLEQGLNPASPDCKSSALNHSATLPPYLNKKIRYEIQDQSLHHP